MSNDRPLPILPPMASLDEKLQEEAETEPKQSKTKPLVSKDADEPPGIPVVVFIVTLVLGSILASLLTDDGIRVTGLGATEQPTSTLSIVIPDPVLSAPTRVPPTPTISIPATSTPAPTVTPTPGPYGDANGNPAPAPEMYPWADWEWRDYASHIVAGEAADTDEGRLVIACTIVRDILRGREPYNLHTRWYGWKNPEWHDRMAMWDALQVEGCRDIPWYRYVGSKRDYQVWLRGGYIRESDPYDVYGNTVAVLE